MDPKTQQRWMMIHNVIHNSSPPNSGVIIEGKKYHVIRSSNGCRALSFREYMFMEQNKNKKSLWANMAQTGTKITWIFKNGYFARIVDDKLEIL